MNEEYETPILSRVYAVMGAVGIMGAVVSVVLAQWPLAAGAFFSGVVCLGIAEIVDLIGRTEFNTRAIPHLGQMLTYLRAIADNTEHKTVASTDGPEWYYFKEGDREMGPFKSSQIRALITIGKLSRHSVAEVELSGARQGAKPLDELGF